VSWAWWAARGKTEKGKGGPGCGLALVNCTAKVACVGGGEKKKEKREGNWAERRELAQQGWNSLFSISNSFLIPRFESNLNRIQNQTKFYSNLKLKHSFKSKQNASSMKCNKQIFIKPK
jgi:hypothetical protein